jgi:hypothetical protein
MNYGVHKARMLVLLFLIVKLERIQNRATRFAKKDYTSRETGAITRMREDLELETLEER